MKKVSFIALAAMLALASCTNSEVTETNPGSPLEFSTSVGRTSRAADTDLNGLKTDGFKLWGFVHDGPEGAISSKFFNSISDGSVNVTFDTAKDKWNYGTLKYWPTPNLSFFAMSPNEIGTTDADGIVHVAADGQKISDYTVKTGAQDLLYSTVANMEKPKTDGDTKVKLNFRHALSKIIFKAKNTDATLDVTVGKVTIKNLNDKGTFTWAEATTATDSPANKGSWSGQSKSAGNGASYSVTGKNTDRLTTTPVIVGADDAASQLFLLPQSFTDNLWAKADGAAGSSTKAHIIVECTVTDKETGIQYYDGEVAIPFTTTAWEIGKAYTYNINFGTGVGVDPTNNKPILVAVDLDVAVDNFDTPADENAESNTNK